MKNCSYDEVQDQIDNEKNRRGVCDNAGHGYQYENEAVKIGKDSVPCHQTTWRNITLKQFRFFSLFITLCISITYH